MAFQGHSMEFHYEKFDAHRVFSFTFSIMNMNVNEKKKVPERSTSAGDRKYTKQIPHINSRYYFIHNIQMNFQKCVRVSGDRPQQRNKWMQKQPSNKLFHYRVTFSIVLHYVEAVFILPDAGLHNAASGNEHHDFRFYWFASQCCCFGHIFFFLFLWSNHSQFYFHATLKCWHEKSIASGGEIELFRKAAGVGW